MIIVAQAEPILTPQEIPPQRFVHGAALGGVDFDTHTAITPAIGLDI